MNPHTPYPDEDPSVPGRPESTPDSAPYARSGGSAENSAAAGEPAQGAPPLYPPGGPYPSHAGATPPSYPGAAGSGAQPQNFFDWIRGHGIHRGRERWIGGVASGIAQRLGVDPLIVRGILIVLTVFAGVGVLLYGLAWAFLPEPDGRIHVQEAAAGRWTSGMTGALVTTIIGFPSLGSGAWGWDRYGFGAFVWTVFWVGGAIYVIYYLTQRNKARGAAAHGTPTYGPAGHDPGFPDRTAPAATAPGSVPDTTLTNLTLPLEGVPAHGWQEHSAAGPATPPPPGPTPPAGGGYGRGYGGYGPVPPPAPAPKSRNLGPGAPAVAVTTGLALLVGGGIKALDAVHAISLGTAGNAVVWASGAAVLGLGILISGLRGRTAGILGFFAVVALIIGGIFNLVPNADRARFQNVNWSPVSIEQAAGGFDITGGTGTVDLTKLNLNPPLGSDVVVRLDATASNVTVAIPANVPVQVQTDLTMGNLNDGRGNHGGMTTQQSDYNTDKTGGRLIVKISGTLSNITVKEGN